MLPRIFSFCFPRRLSTASVFVWTSVFICIALIYLKFPSSKNGISKVSVPSCSDREFCAENIIPPTPRRRVIDHIDINCQEHHLETHSLPIKGLQSSFYPNDKEKRATIVLFTITKTPKLATFLKYLLTPIRVYYLHQVPSWNQSEVLYHLKQLDAHLVKLVIFEDFAVYTNLPSWQRIAIDSYCKDKHVGVIGFLNDGNAFSTEPNTDAKLGHLPIYLNRLSNYPDGLFVARNASALRITRRGRMQSGPLQPDRLKMDTVSEPCCLATLVPQKGFERSYVPLLFTMVNTSLGSPIQNQSCVTGGKQAIYQSLAIEDMGLVDGVRRVLFATRPTGLWINSMLLLDVIVHLGGSSYFHASPPISVPWAEDTIDLAKQLSNGSRDLGKATLDLNRWILIDIDDVFLHGSGVDFTPEDATSLALVQHRWRQWIPKFRFNLGFCGRFFERANSTDRRGYEKLLELRREFWWFDHLWNHYQAHTLEKKQLIQFMRQNQEFAKVLPRQTCSVNSRSIELKDYPGGVERMRRIVAGGSLFQTLLLNPVSVFMTHMTNYKGDRLAPHLFDAVFRHLKCWTNLRLKTASGTQLGQLYAARFDSTGANELPLYTDPCSDRRNRAIWPADWPCGRTNLPQLVILGPQKTGTTALVQFLRLIPTLVANRYQRGSTFEELQFFSSNAIYSRGPQWYMRQFSRETPMASTSTANPSEAENNSTIRFEKSATYFADPKSAPRLHALVSDARLIVMLKNPVQRAYSWYQHNLAHKNPASRMLSFANLMRFGARQVDQTELEILAESDQWMAFQEEHGDNETVVEELLASIRRLAHGCVEPGDYERHLSRWLEYFPDHRILLIDSDRFQRAPSTVLSIVQQFLQLPNTVNFSAYLEYNPTKRFFCLRSGYRFPPWSGNDSPHNAQCLGPGKGRTYPPLTGVSGFMQTHFATANARLLQLFRDHPVWRWWMARSGAEVPDWLTGA